MLFRPAFNHFIHVKIPERTHTAEQMYRPVQLDMKGMLKHAFQRREAGTAAHQDDWSFRVLAQEERTQRPFDSQNRLFFHVVEHVIRELATVDVTLHGVTIPAGQTTSPAFTVTGVDDTDSDGDVAYTDLLVDTYAPVLD